jgi:ElaB/YqjD/DUF883 family membrane-anchored ribosome-binding protein
MAASSSPSSSYPGKSGNLSSSSIGLSGSSAGTSDDGSPEKSSFDTAGNTGSSLSGTGSGAGFSASSERYEGGSTGTAGSNGGYDTAAGTQALKSKAQEFAQATMSTAKDLTGRAWHGASDTVKRCEMYVQERPLQSALIAAGVGAALMLLVTSRTSRHHY